MLSRQTFTIRLTIKHDSAIFVASLCITLCLGSPRFHHIARTCRISRLPRSTRNIYLFPLFLSLPMSDRSELVLRWNEVSFERVKTSNDGRRHEKQTKYGRRSDPSFVSTSVVERYELTFLCARYSLVRQPTNILDN